MNAARTGLLARLGGGGSIDRVRSGFWFSRARVLYVAGCTMCFLVSHGADARRHSSFRKRECARELDRTDDPAAYERVHGHAIARTRDARLGKLRCHKGSAPSSIANIDLNHKDRPRYSIVGLRLIVRFLFLRLSPSSSSLSLHLFLFLAFTTLSLLL